MTNSNELKGLEEHVRNSFADGMIIAQDEMRFFQGRRLIGILPYEWDGVNMQLNQGQAISPDGSEYLEPKSLLSRVIGDRSDVGGLGVAWVGHQQHVRSSIRRRITEAYSAFHLLMDRTYGAETLGRAQDLRISQLAEELYGHANTDRAA